MASVKELKLNLRTHINLRMHDFREMGECNDQYKHIAYGAIWAANWAKAISDQERDAYLAELYPPKSAQPQKGVAA